MVINTSEGGVFYAPGNSSTLTQLAALPNHTHSGYVTTTQLADYLPKSGGALSGNLYIDGDWTTDIGLYFREGSDDKYGFNFTYGDGDYFRLNTRGGSTTNTEVFKVYRGSTSITFASTPYVGSTKVSLEGHAHDYLPLSGGTINSTDITPLRINTSYNANGVANSWIGAIHCFNTSLSPNQHFTIDVGQSASTKNEGWLGFYYVANGSNNNRLSLGLHSMDDVINIFGSGNVSIGNAQNTTADEKLHVHGNVKATSFIGTATNSNGLAGYTWEAKQNSVDTWVPVFTGNKLQYRVIPTAYNSAPSTLSVGYATSAGSATKLTSTAINFQPAETALTPDNVYTLVGGTTIKRGTWSYAGNGYISNNITGVGTIDLAGTTVIQADTGNPGYTQLYLTPSTGSTTGCKTNEIFMYNNNGSGYSPSWTRVLTDRNYSEYCLPITGGTVIGTTTFNEEVKMIKAGSSDICVGVACDFKSNRSQISNLVTNYIYLGKESTDKNIRFRSYSSISYASPASPIDLLVISSSGCTATNFITNSDKRLKTNIKPIPTNSKSLELNFYEFDYVNNDNHSAGHIAQEVKEVYPELVHGNESETEHLSIDYTGLHSIQIHDLIDYIKRLEKRIIELENKL